MLRVEVDRAYGKFFDLPVPAVFVVLWVVGVMIEALCVSVLYSLYWNGLGLAQSLEGYF
jgi:hypothetical protein